VVEVVFLLVKEDSEGGNARCISVDVDSDGGSANGFSSSSRGGAGGCSSSGINILEGTPSGLGMFFSMPRM
jgi:hypothetical protein